MSRFGGRVDVGSGDITRSIYGYISWSWVRCNDAREFLTKRRILFPANLTLPTQMELIVWHNTVNQCSGNNIFPARVLLCNQTN